MVILASKSPRRKELLAQLGFDFSSVSADIDESIQKNESPSNYVERLAIEKAKAVALLSSDEVIVLGSDTSVVIDDKILGKPADLNICIEMLSQLSNRRHQVYTAVAIVQGSRVMSKVVVTDVIFRSLSLDDIKAYWETGEPQDKAGSYGIQGLGGQFVRSIEGSYSSVVGLPLVETTELLQQFGVKLTLSSGSCS